MVVELSDLQSNLIGKIAKEKGFENFTTEVSSGSTKGDGYLGHITRVNIKEKTGSKILHLILKSSSSSEDLRKHSPIRQIFLREITLYEKVFPTFTNFAISNGTKPFSATATFYGSLDVDKNECLVLENLKENDYKLWNRKEPMNSEHVAMVFAEYGKFHAFSLAMRHLEPENYHEVTKNLNNVFETTLEEMEKITISKFEQLLEIIEPGTNEWKAVRKFIDNGAATFLMETKTEEDEYYVITHGDCWSNNMMFQYKDDRNPANPTKMCLIDWQISRTGSPVFDLSYFFYACCPKEILNDYKTYWNIYYESLSKTLKDLGCDAEKLFPYNVLENHWKKFSIFGLYVSMMVVKVMLSDVEEAPDMEAMAKSGKRMVDVLSDFKFGLEETYNKRMRDIVAFMTENDFF